MRAWSGICRKTILQSLTDREEKKGLIQLAVSKLRGNDHDNGNDNHDDDDYDDGRDDHPGPGSSKPS